jgi:DNA-binding NtrC family response regulator
VITTAHLALAPVAPPPRAAQEAPAASQPQPSCTGDLHSMERAMIEQALQRARFNKSRAAKAIGLTRHQLYVRLRKHGFLDVAAGEPALMSAT